MEDRQKEGNEVKHTMQEHMQKAIKDIGQNGEDYAKRIKQIIVGGLNKEQDEEEIKKQIEEIIKEVGGAVPTKFRGQGISHTQHVEIVNLSLSSERNCYYSINYNCIN